jgi:hypothetical protein
MKRKAKVEARSNGETIDWCVVWKRKVYPFGADDVGKVMAREAARDLEQGTAEYSQDNSYRKLTP